MHNNNSSNYNNFGNEIFSQEVYAGRNRSYFIIVKQDRNGEMYLTIKELKFNMDGTKEVHRVMIFQADFGNFLVGMQKAVDFIKSENKQAIAIRLKPTFKETENDDSNQLPTPLVSTINRSTPLSQVKTNIDRPINSLGNHNPNSTIIQLKNTFEESNSHDDKVVSEVRVKLPEKEIVTFDDLDDLLDMN
jgi:Protein of unknown function (DUF3276)